VCVRVRYLLSATYKQNVARQSLDSAQFTAIQTPGEHPNHWVIGFVNR